MKSKEDISHYLPPLTKKQKELRKKLNITCEIVNHNKPTLKKRENRDELR